MKVLFNWSIIISALTIYLYWYGYWYTEGYFRFFSQDIKAFDIPLQHIVMAGVLQSLVILIWIVSALIFVSLLLQFSKNQYSWLFKKVEIFIIYIWFNLTGLLKLLLDRFSKIEFIFILKEKIGKNCFIRRLVKITRSIKNKINSFWRQVVYRVVVFIEFNKSISTKEVVRIQEIKVDKLGYDIKKENTTTFDIQYILHSIIIITVLLFFLASIDYANKTNKKGFVDAKEAYICSLAPTKKDCNSFYRQIILHDVQAQTNVNLNNNSGNRLIQKWYLTEICLNKRCLVFNEKKEAKFIDITNKKILIGDSS